MKKYRIGVVLSEFNADITYLMLEVAKTHADFLGVTLHKIVKSPGTYDMPLLIKGLLQRDDIDAVITLGAVIKGETKHDEIVVSHASRKIVDLSLQYDKPVTLGIIGPGVSHAQAKQRIESYAKRTLESAVKILREQENLVQKSRAK